MRAPIAVSLLIAWSAQAAIYENSIEAEDEDDIQELEQRGDISEDTADTLLELMREGVDLNSANREQLYDLPGLTYADVDALLEYRKAKGRIDDPTELVGAGAITAEQLLQISPFIRIDAAKPILPISGKFRAQTRFTTTDNVPPPALLTARLKGPENLSAGFLAFTTRRRAATPTYDPVTDELQSTGFTYQPWLARIFAQWKPGNARLIVGTFTIGFAERLTLDNTRRVTPRGLYLVDDFRRVNTLTSTCKLSSSGFLADPTSGCDQADGKSLYITPDYKWRDSFRGVAGSIEDLKVGDQGSVSMYGFLSYQQRSIYQYELYDRRFCDDPRDNTNDFCKAPSVYLPDQTTRLVYSTLGNAFDELTGGGHVTFKPMYRITLGATGYAAMPFFKQSPLQLDFQEYSRYPTGGPFGAVGLDAHGSFNGFNFFIEGAHNFDGRFGDQSKGGWGVEQRTTYSTRKHEFELSLRLYDPGFGTPYARPIASPDLLEGQRARNEAGLRFRYMGHLSKDWEVRLRVNAWTNPWQVAGDMPPGVFNVYALGRVDFVGWSFFQPGIWIDARNKNVARSEHGGCSSETVILTDGAPYTCSGDMYKFAARMEFMPYNKLISGTVQGAFTLKDDLRYKDRFRNDLQFWVELRSRPVDWLQLRVRTRYLNQDIDDPAYLETSSWSYAEVAFALANWMRIGVRYDLFVYLDQRSSTANRIPNPEHRMQLDLRGAF